MVIAQPYVRDATQDNDGARESYYLNKPSSSLFFEKRGGGTKMPT